MVPNENTYRSDVAYTFAVSEGMKSWIPRFLMCANRGNAIKTLLHNKMVSLPHRYRGIYGYRGTV